ncbi:TM0106 family RecB-like putative nuclease, partial [Aliikangiella coralliicola]
MSLVNLNANQIINQKYFQAVLECDLKAYLLKFEECNAVENEYSLILKENLNNQKSTYLKMLRLGEREVRQFSPSEFEKMTPLLVNASLNTKSLSAYCDSLHLVKDRKSGVDYYQASLLIPRAKLTRNDKKVLAYIAFVLSKLTKYVPPKGVLVDSKLKCHKVSTDKLYGEVEKKVDYLIELFMRKEPPELHLNSHCQYCCFQERCFNLAKGSDHLSLLSGISSKEIRRLNKRGIFTVTQYSYVYRYRKRNSDSIGIKYSTSLKALACRTQKTYIVDKPKLPNKHVQIYFDVESVPERNFFYLIGTVVVTDESKASYSFWADSEHDEYSIFLKF